MPDRIHQLEVLAITISFGIRGTPRPYKPIYIIIPQSVSITQSLAMIVVSMDDCRDGCLLRFLRLISSEMGHCSALDSIEVTVTVGRHESGIADITCR